MVLSRRSPEDRRLEPVRYASVWPNCSKGTTSHSRSNEATSARPLAIAAHAPARMNRESPSEGRASEGAFILSCCVVIFFLLAVSVAVAFCVLAIASWLVHSRLGFEPNGRLGGPQRLLLSVFARQIRWTCHDDHHDRHHTPPGGEQPGHPRQLCFCERRITSSRIRSGQCRTARPTVLLLRLQIC